MEYDIIYWSAVENATSYTITVNSDYTYTTASLSASIENATYNGNRISTIGEVYIVVRANGTGLYKNSDDSSIYYYYYIPEKSSLSSAEEAYRDFEFMGHGYNLIEYDDYIKSELTSHYSVLNIDKLLSLSTVSTDNSEGLTDSYQFSSMDELATRYNISADISGGINIGDLGKIKMQYTLEGSGNYSKYSYNQTYVAVDGILKHTYVLKNYDDALLKYCLTQTFIEDIKKSESMSDNAWLEYMYNRYGTHVILGVKTGGYWIAEYVLSTNSESKMQEIKQKLNYSGSAKISSLVGIDVGLELNEEKGDTWTGSETEAHLNIEWRGSVKGGTVTADNIDSAIQNFEDGITDDTAVPVGIPKDGAIALSTLISRVDASMGEKYEKYLSTKADEEYYKLYSQYTKPSTLPMQIENENGLNVLRIDLSAYQNGGSLGSAYNVNLLNGILTIYPKMEGKRVDKIVISGALDEYSNLINGFSIKLAKGWNKDIDIIVDNLGVIPASNYGLIDLSDIPANYDINVEYTGINAIKNKTSGDIEFYASINGEEYRLNFTLNDDEMLDMSTVQITSELRLPIATKDNYSFIGWFDSDGNQISNDKGYIVDGYSTDNILTTLYAHWTPIVFKVTFDHQGASEHTDVDHYFIQGNIGAFKDYGATDPIFNETTNNPFPIPTKPGYVFVGYFRTVENNGTTNAVGTEQYIDANGYIVIDSITHNAEENVIIYAKWIPSLNVITLDPGVSDSKGTTEYYVVYDVGIYSDPGCTKIISKITAPTKSGYIFAGYFTGPDRTGKQIINADGTINSEESKKFNSETTLYASWTTVVTITLDGQTTNTYGTRKLYVDPGVNVYDTIKCDQTINHIVCPTKNGYSFEGYYYNDVKYIDENGMILDNIINIDSNTTLIAKWKSITYTVRYFSDYGYVLHTQTCEFGKEYKTYTQNNFYGYRFICWYNPSNIITITFDFGESFKDLTSIAGTVIDLYPEVQRLRYNISFDGNGATNGYMSTMTNCYWLEEYSLPANQFTRTGYRFIGWEYNGVTYRDCSIVSNLTNDYEGTVTMRAQWEKLPDNKITFSINGCTSIDDSDRGLCMFGSQTVSYTYDTTYRIHYVGAKSGKTFIGWSTSPNGSVVYRNGDIIGNVGTITLYAIFR